MSALAARLFAWGQNSPDPAFFVGDALSAVLGDCADAATALSAQEAEIKRYRAALTECAAEWRSPPTTMGRALEHVSVEFKRRMQIAADVLSKVEG